MTTDIPFNTFGRVMAFYRFRNPARQKFTNIYEPDKGGYSELFSGDNGTFLFATVANAIARVLSRKSKVAADCFTYWHIQLRDTDKGIDFISKIFNIPTRQVWKNIRQCEEEIANILIDKRVLDPFYEDNARIAAQIKKQEDKPN